VAVAEPTATGRVIAAWPSFALIASYELLTRQVRRAADGGMSRQRSSPSRGASRPAMASQVPSGAIAIAFTQAAVGAGQCRRQLRSGSTAEAVCT
jgi:hypothetical protein